MIRFHPCHLDFVILQFTESEAGGVSDGGRRCLGILEKAYQIADEGCRQMRNKGYKGKKRIMPPILKIQPEWAGRL